MTDTKTTSRPAWLSEFLNAFEAAEACAFLFHTGISDYVRPGVSVTQYLQKWLSGPFETVVSYSVSKGITFAQPHMRERYYKTLSQPDPNPEGPILMAPEPAVAELLTFLRRAPKQTAAVVLERVDHMVGEIVPVDASVISLMEILHDAGTDPVLEKSGNPLLMLTPMLESVRPEVRRISSGIKAIEIPLPDYTARHIFAKERLADDDCASIQLSGITVEQLAAITAGLYRRHIENIMLRARENGGKLTRELATSVQRELMDVEYAGIVKRVDKPFHMADVGGHTEAKAYLTKRVIDRLRNNKRAPNAVLFVGPPGTGKTMLANAAANDSGLNCLEVDLSQLMGGIVGETEQNIARFRQAVIANAPCMVFCDEIDQKARRGEGGADSGGGGAVENRLFAALLELVEGLKQHGVVWVFASNRPDLLDEAFMSRMQAVIPLLPAEDDAARADVLWRIVKRLSNAGSHDEMPTNIGEQAKRMTDWSGRDVEQVVAEALSLAEDDDRPLADTLDETITYRRVHVLDVKRQVAEALHACKDLRLIPERYRDQAKQTEQDSGTGSGMRQQRKLKAETDWMN